MIGSRRAASRWARASSGVTRPGIGASLSRPGASSSPARSIVSACRYAPVARPVSAAQELAMPRAARPSRRDPTDLAGLRVALYCRVSQDRYRTEKSVDDQEAEGRRWVSEHGAVLAGLSPTTTGRPPGMPAAPGALRPAGRGHQGREAGRDLGLGAVPAPAGPERLRPPAGPLPDPPGAVDQPGPGPGPGRLPGHDHDRHPGCDRGAGKRGDLRAGPAGPVLLGRPGAGPTA
jgi:hypothetical protein